MTQYLTYIFGSVSFLGGVYMFLLSFKIYKPKHKTEEQRERMKKWHEKLGSFMKIASVILIINGAYDLIARNSDRYKIGQTEKTEWSASDNQVLVENCMRDAKTTATNYPIITREYCECSMGKIMSEITYTAYVESLKKPTDEQLKIIMPLIQECVDELRKRIDEENK